MMFDIEKEKARWQMENDNILSQKRELEDIISNLERRKDLLFKENERLKQELKGDSRSQNRSSNLNLSLGFERKNSKTNTQQMMGMKGIQSGIPK
jgi:hypothetical protein